MVNRRFIFITFMPLLIFSTAFLAIPLIQLFASSINSEQGFGIYLEIIKKPRYLQTLFNTLWVSILTTIAALIIATTVGLFLERNTFKGRSILISILTFPLAFPGVVVGFVIILLGGRQGLVNDISKSVFDTKVVFAYSILGLILGYLYFSIPRILLTIMAAAEKLDKDLENAARSMGANPFRVLIDVILPGLMPAIIASGAIAFATSMGAFGTAFTLATDIDVLPMVIYTEFTLSANIAMASALSILLGLVTWLMLLIARSFSGQAVAASG